MGWEFFSSPTSTNKLQGPPPQTPIQWVPGALSPGGKAPPSCSEVKECVELATPSLSQNVFIARCFVKHSDNFTFSSDTEKDTHGATSVSEDPTMNENTFRLSVTHAAWYMSQNASPQTWVPISRSLPTLKTIDSCPRLVICHRSLYEIFNLDTQVGCGTHVVKSSRKFENMPESKEFNGTNQ
jgi:hypothetical protein